jgi:hypothetical protein
MAMRREPLNNGLAHGRLPPEITRVIEAIARDLAREDHACHCLELFRLSYLPCQFGVRLLRKASMPSRKSSLI